MLNPFKPRIIKGGATGASRVDALAAYSEMCEHHDWKIVGEAKIGSVYSLQLERSAPSLIDAVIGKPSITTGAATGKTKDDAYAAFLAMRKHHDWKIVGEQNHGAVFSYRLERPASPTPSAA